MSCTADDQRTCLHLAASEGNIHVVELLAAHGAEINAKDRWGGTPLQDAVREGHRAVAALLFERGSHLGMNDLTLAMAMCQHARLGKLESLEELVRTGADPNAVDYDGRSPLHIAAADGNKVIVQSLIALGCRADTKDRWGMTARQGADIAGHLWPDSLWEGQG